MDDKLEINNVIAMMSFAEVVSTGSFSAAATSLGYSKAAVSRQISRLEASVGMKLLERNTRTVTLTPVGREMYARCARIVDEVNEANRVMNGMQQKPRGDLKVNAPVVSSLFDLTKIIPRFLQAYSDIRLFINLSDSRADLLKGRFDVSFWIGEPYDANLDSVMLREYPMVLVASPAYLDRVGRPKAAGDLKEHVCISETHLSQLGEWRLSKDVTVAIGRGPLTSNSVRMAREASLQDLGVSYMPRFLVADDIDAGRLEVLLPDLVTETIPLHLLFPKGSYMLSKVRAFVDFVASEVREGPAASVGGGIALTQAY
ncbi:LysR family transcriptional regulator [Novosphingobium humi]|uniref:LysR family transcriptional regulator n=1 Tax=Novosphingobium humi TaxID=2282397 RepID=UPI0025AF43E9|nr:LysR family transcriptional regulator [Novosphingobium humi]WJT01020.1 LysR family transcriptional regulator [Novosphingobium humi]